MNSFSAFDSLTTDNKKKRKCNDKDVKNKKKKTVLPPADDDDDDTRSNVSAVRADSPSHEEDKQKFDIILNSFTQTAEESIEDEDPTEENQSSEKQGIEKVVEDIGKLLVSGEDSDVTVQVGDVEFKAHRTILSARCPVLSAMFRHETAEKISNKITIRDCEPEVFGDFLHYLYKGSAQHLSEKNVFGLYRVADQYLADDLKQQCLQHVRDTLSVQTFCDAVQLALTHGQSGLLQQAMDFATQNIRSIIRTVEWQNFSRDHPTEANEILIKALGPPS